MNTSKDSPPALQLALLGKIIDYEDQIDYVLQGLPEEYKSLVDQTESRDTPPSITELHEKLINHEAKIQTASNTSSLTPLPITANYTNNRNKPYTARGNQKQSQPWSNNRNYDQNRSHDQNRSSRPYLGRCQLCGTQGHSARRCPQLQTGSSLYHGLLPTPQTPTASWNPCANVATASPWILDSGATHHITSDLANLSLHQPYNGGEEVVIGDGSALPITNTGSTFLLSVSKPLSLKNVLCVPDIHKNLVSVYKLCNTNQVSVEFFSASFQVKDLSSGARYSKAVLGRSFTSGQYRKQQRVTLQLQQ